MFTCKRSLTALALVTLTACGSSVDATDRGDAAAPGQQPGSDPDAGGPKATPVEGTPDNDSITEEKGVFVAPSGDDGADASRGRPLKTLSAAITTATRLGKIVFACTGTYAEPLVVSDSISIIGGLDCGDPLKWKTGSAPSRVVSPSSPAAIAKAITAPTRLEALDIVAPDATAPGASSIGFFADHSPGLTIVGSKITAGNAAGGTNGNAGVALTQGADPKGADSTPQVACHGPTGGMLGVAGNCGYSQLDFGYHSLPGGKGGTSQCIGAADKNGGPGDIGGTGGLWKPNIAGVNSWALYSPTSGTGTGGASTGAVGTHGDDGAPAGIVGSLTADGYVPADGSPGKDGGAGGGGHGGTGFSASGSTAGVSAASGVGGAGGGAGGCPGLAGGAGTGGGASLGMALVASPLVLDGTTVTSATGGAAGLGSLGSDPTAGGAAGVALPNTTDALAGGDGGAPGVSTNGSNGPSVGILVSGASPTLTGNAKATPGAGGASVGEVSATVFGVKRTVPASPTGLSAAIKVL